MDEAHRLASEGSPEGTLVVAKRQQKGRGRQGRSWLSPEGGLYCSFVLRPKQPTALEQLSLVAGLSSAEAIKEVASINASLRWPNDLLLSGKKVGGILSEAKNGAVVIGIGINVQSNLKMLPDVATSLCESSSSDCSPDKLLSSLCRHLSKWYHVWTDEGFAPIRTALCAWIGSLGEPVRVNVGSQHFEGIASNIDESGRLLVRLDSGLMRAFNAGEVTLLR
jgi:BirA family biotin operon repressor/biotin-[acetyl-CoA-carboxylase] ligase